MNEELYQRIQAIDEEAAEHYRVICLFRLAAPAREDRPEECWKSDTLFYGFAWDETPQGYEYWYRISKKLGEVWS